ncbi:hypothetical protein [Nitrosomonas halophila]|uniref:hypothetical protein n=1 Tax=Nitrosomonas halophila TaxID=44576 RepID=UPI00115FA228|nr:hypothetical protein [Nitrosomonas halophila]
MSFAFHAIYWQMLPIDLDIAQDDMLCIDDADCIVATSSQEDGALAGFWSGDDNGGMCLSAEAVDGEAALVEAGCEQQLVARPKISELMVIIIRISRVEFSCGYGR